jgi:hypothetical protein
MWLRSVAEELPRRSRSWGVGYFPRMRRCVTGRGVITTSTLRWCPSSAAAAMADDLDDEDEDDPAGSGVAALVCRRIGPRTSPKTKITTARDREEGNISLLFVGLCNAVEG